jgi:hypothetical protein
MAVITTKLPFIPSAGNGGFPPFLTKSIVPLRDKLIVLIRVHPSRSSHPVANDMGL